MAQIKQTIQPQHAYQIDPYWLSRGLRFVNLPTCGFMNVCLPSSIVQSSGQYPANISQEGLAFTGNARAEIGQTMDPAKGITLISVWHCRDASNYTNADADRTLLSNRTAGNAGWSWGRSGAIGGGAGGNVTRQGLTFQGVAAYTEANYTIESLVDTPVACRYNPVTGNISWFRFGLASSADTAAGTPSSGGNLVFGAQGDYASNGQPWIDKAVATLAFDTALSDTEIAILTSSVGNLWQIFLRPGRTVAVAVAGGGVSGTLAYTNANDTLAASGSTTIVGSLARTNTNDSVSASGSTTIVGALARTNANDTVSASGTTTITGSVAYTNINDSVAASGLAGAITGTVNYANTNDVCAAYGSTPNSQTSGGFMEVPQVGRRRSVKEERERLGIIPKEVKQVILAVARATVAADTTDTQAEARLARRLEQQDIEAKAKYAEFMQQERDRLRARDIARSLQIQRRRKQLEDEDEREVEMLLM